jgi:nucleoside-diphosphate-sugar epimerase
MDKIIIVGTYEFIGYQLCLSLLEQGREVIGIHLNTHSQDLFLEEKRFGIGRNSNFIERDETFFDSSDPLSDPMILFIDYYSFYFKREEKKLSSIINTNFLKMDSIHFVFTLPVQLIHETGLIERTLFQESDEKVATTIFFLPTIYGPWQPMKYVFQQALCNPNGSIILDEREWTEDALYINDVMEIILQELEGKRKKVYLFKSKVEEHWKKVLRILLGKSELESTHYKQEPLNPDITVIDVGDTEPQDGIENQKRHLSGLKKIL